MNRLLLLRCIIVSVAIITQSIGAMEWHEEFTAAEKWLLTGEGEVGAKNATDGSGALCLRRDAATLPETAAEGPLFTAEPGIWEISAAARHTLYSPDQSFNVELVAEFLDSQGKSLDTCRVLTFDGRADWTTFRQSLDFPINCAQARLRLRFNKTHGDFSISQLRVRRISDLVEQTGGERITRFSAATPGFMFRPEQEARITVRIETPRSAPTADNSSTLLNWEVTDYHGARQFPSGKAALQMTSAKTGDHNAYTAEISLGHLPLRTGKFYRLRTACDLGAPRRAEDEITFAVLPEAAANEFPAEAIPFGGHTWDARLHEYFALSARLGLRRCLVFWQYEPGQEEGDHGIIEGEYKHNYTLGWPRRYGLRPYAIWYPIFDIERGKYEFEPGLAAGIQRALEIGRPQGLWGIQIGNEPPHWNEEMIARDVRAYKVAYDAAKAADPGTFIIGSAIGPTEVFFKSGFQNSCDAYNIHSYAGAASLRQSMRKYGELFEKYGGKKPIYSTEIGLKSQGLPRDRIAIELIRSAAVFFAEGGEFFTWFAISYPDPTGKRRGSYGDSMDLFAGYLNMYAPRIDAVAYYHLVNNMLDKRFAAERRYPGGCEAFLFTNAQNRCLQILWNDTGKTEGIFLALPQAQEVRVTLLDGTSTLLDARGEGIGLRIGEEPVLLTYYSPTPVLAENLTEARLRIVALPQELIPGVAAPLEFERNDNERFSFALPDGWQCGEVLSGTSTRRIFQLTAPEDAPAGIADINVTTGSPDGLPQALLNLRLPVAPRVVARIYPLPADVSGTPGLRLDITNNFSDDREFDWQVSLSEQIPLTQGRLNFARTVSAEAVPLPAPVGRAKVAGSSRQSVEVRLDNVDPLSLYRIKATVSGTGDIHATHERLVGGFAAVRKVRRPLIDGLPAAEDWQGAQTLTLDQARQWYHDNTQAPGNWEGPQDLSGKLSFLWDANCLYLRCMVRDDIFANPGADNRLWDMDGLQILVDPFRAQAQTLGRYDIALGLGQKGAQAWCHLSASGTAPVGEATDIRVITDMGARGDIEYRVAIPWARLAPFAPQAGANLGLSLIINEDDGEGRCGFMAWFSGVHLKEVGHVGDLILEE